MSIAKLASRKKTKKPALKRRKPQPPPELSPEEQEKKTIIAEIRDFYRRTKYRYQEVVPLETYSLEALQNHLAKLKADRWPWLYALR